MAVQLRARQLAENELARAGRALCAVCRAVGSPLLVNGRIDVAQAIDADGVHLPEAGPSIADARRLLGPGKLVGVSRHDESGLSARALQGADFAVLSPVHAVPGKAPPLGIAGFERLARATSLPLYALGGVRAENVAPLLTAGARGVAVIRSVLAADDPGAAALAILARFPHHRR